MKGNFRKNLKWFSTILPDSLYIKLMFRKYIGYFPNLRKPKTFNEKLNWLKLHDRNPKYCYMVDKYEAKKYVSDIIGKEYVIPAIGVWERFEDIDFSQLPKQFVLKCTHDSGGLIIVHDKERLDMEEAKKKLSSCLKRNFFFSGREWPYKNLKPRILAEEFKEDTRTGELRDYKFLTFNGQAKLLYIATERQKKNSSTKFDFFDMDFKHLEITNGHQCAAIPPEKPINFEKMKELSEKLSKGIPHVRVDFYEVDGKVYFGEMTFYQMSGFVPIEPPAWDLKMGSWINLPKEKKHDKHSRR